MAARNVTKKMNTPEVENSRQRSSIVADDFDFYHQLAKLMILRKGNTEVTSKYSTWLKALKDHKNSDTRQAYVKLLVMGLQHPDSVCPFNEYPPAVIDPLDCDLMDKAKTIIRSTDAVCKGIVLNPPVMTVVSEDRCQYAASQVVPKVGIQCYYARADYPLSDWNFYLLSSKPSKPMHAAPLDWERSLAGIFKKPVSSKSGTAFNSDTASNMSADTKHVKFSLKSATEACKILNLLQEGIDVGANVFKWYEKSLLTGDTIAGSELCIDWVVHEHERTQLEIDEEIVSSFDKLYPGNFRLIANPDLLEGIYRKLQCGQQNLNWMDNQCKKNEAPPPRQCGGNDQGPVKVKYSDQTKRKHSDIDLTVVNQHGESRVNFSEINAMTEFKDCNISPADPLISSSVTLTETGEVNIGFMSSDLPPTLPSYMEAAKCFSDVANKAENTIREVNNWLKEKEEQRRKKYNLY